MSSQSSRNDRHVKPHAPRHTRAASSGCTSSFIRAVKVTCLNRNHSSDLSVYREEKGEEEKKEEEEEEKA